MTASKSFIEDNIEDNILEIFGTLEKSRLNINEIFNSNCCHFYSKNEIKNILNKMVNEKLLHVENNNYYCIKDPIFLSSLNKIEKDILFLIGEDFCYGYNSFDILDIYKRVKENISIDGFECILKDFIKKKYIFVYKYNNHIYCKLYPHIYYKIFGITNGEKIQIEQINEECCCIIL